MPSGKRTLRRTERRGDNTSVDDCGKLSDFQLQENDSYAHKHNFHAVYTDTYMKYVELELGSRTGRYSSRLVKTSSVFLMHILCP
jgi:hypothetical protein